MANNKVLYKGNCLPNRLRNSLPERDCVFTHRLSLRVAGSVIHVISSQLTFAMKERSQPGNCRQQMMVSHSSAAHGCHPVCHCHVAPPSLLYPPPGLHPSLHSTKLLRQNNEPRGPHYMDSVTCGYFPFFFSTFMTKKGSNNRKSVVTR